jgi:hypothetical protein
VTVPWWVLLVLFAVTGGVGVLSGLIVHWWLELRACIRTDTGADTLRP